MPARQASDPGTASRDRFAFFAFLLALTIFLDHLRFATFTSPLKIATVVAAVAVMRWPSSVRLFLGLVVVQTFGPSVELPFLDAPASCAGEL